MKKALMITAMVLASSTAHAGNAVDYFFGNLITLPANSVLNDSNNAKRIPNPGAMTQIDINQALGAVIGTVIDPRGYNGKAYPGGNRPGLNVHFGNLRTGKCYSDPKSNGVYCE